MPEPVSQYVETEEESGWPLPAARPVSIARVPPARRRTALDAIAVLLAALGFAAAAGAAVWYLHLGRDGTLTVPRVVGLRERAAVRELTDEGFAVRAVERPARGRRGFVVAQHPAVATRLPHGATVTIQVANGQRP